jgi:tudor domain-containing protein 3
VGAGVPDLQKGRFESIEHEVVVLQILKIRNISAPKANESSKTAPKLLKVQLTDGVNTLSAIEMESTSLSIETKPGTKVSRENPFRCH